MERRVIVPRGHRAWWGVDPSTLRVSVACCWNVDGETLRSVRTTPFARLEGPGRLSEIYRETRRFMEALVSPLVVHRWQPWPRPGVVLIEQPSGEHGKPALSYAVGVIQAAVWDGLHDALGTPPRVEMVTSGHWKKVACGRGNIYKPKAGETYEVLEWARRNGYAGESWDEADALGIAECARIEIGLEER